MLSPARAGSDPAGRSPLKRVQLPNRNDAPALAAGDEGGRGPDYFHRPISRSFQDVRSYRERGAGHGLAAVGPKQMPQASRPNPGYRESETDMITLLSGTNRPGSNTLKVVNILEGMYHDLKVPLQVLDLTQLPPEIFSASSYAEKPKSFLPFSDAILKSAGVHIVTPEYNGGVPGVLKYFI